MVAPGAGLAKAATVGTPDLDGMRLAVSVTDALGRAVVPDFVEPESGDGAGLPETDEVRGARVVGGAIGGFVGTMEARRVGAGGLVVVDEGSDGLVVVDAGEDVFVAGGDVGPADDLFSMLVAPAVLVAGAEVLVVFVTVGGDALAVPAPNVPELRICHE